VKSPWLNTLLVLLALLTTAVLVAAQHGTDRKAGLFAPLKEGQHVNLKEAGGGYQITLIPGMQIGHKIVEIGSDYIVLLDAAGVSETRIPVFALRSISITRLPDEK
jgi:hypothetical protein